MNEKDFLVNYLQPSDHKLDRTFTHPLPDIEGLKKCGDFIVQGELEETTSTNIISKFESDTSGIRVIEVYKNTQHKFTGIFIRLMGTINFVKIGYPFLFLDAAVTNVNFITAQKEDIGTTVAIHLPQADHDQSEMLIARLNKKAKEDGISCSDRKPDNLPDFWGSVWVGKSKGFNPDMIKRLRDHAWISYKYLIEQTKDKSPFDYKPMQEHMIFNISQSEHLLFKKLGLSVPMESQAAFFSVMVSGA